MFMTRKSYAYNRKWYESMLAHGYEGVREIEHRVSNTCGWGATNDAVEGWVYQDMAGAFWDVDDEPIEQLKGIYGDLEDRLEGVVIA